ncbi:hypothetical protein GCK32_021080, partial [Trichostrongylus colubriformis]
ISIEAQCLYAVCCASLSSRNVYFNRCHLPCHKCI